MAEHRAAASSSQSDKGAGVALIPYKAIIQKVNKCK